MALTERGQESLLEGIVALSERKIGNGMRTTERVEKNNIGLEDKCLTRDSQ